jgi:DNA-binding GntR family transcriptional regulator
MMKPLEKIPNLTEQAYQVLVDQICDGSLPPGSHLVQEQIAKSLGVSRQPIQQVMNLLKADGLVEEAPGRGMMVIPLNVSLIRGRYQIRTAMDGLAAELAAVRVRSSKKVKDEIAEQGQAIIKAGISAIKAKSIKRLVACDVEFHNFLYEYSGNPLIGPTCEPHWLHLRLVMSEVLRKATLPKNIWQQHEEILSAVLEGEAKRAKSLAIKHVEQSCQDLTNVLTSEASLN